MERNKIKTIPHTNDRPRLAAINTITVDDELKDSGTDLLEYWSVIKRYSKKILGLTLVITLVGILTAFSLKPIYLGEVSLLVEPESPKIVSLDPIQNATNTLFFYQTQKEVIKSRTISESVIDNLNLKNSARLANDIPILRASEKERGDDWLFSTKKNKDEEQVKIALLKYLSDNLSVENQKNSQIIKISFDASDPKLASDIANGFAQAYINKGLEAHVSISKKATGWLRKRLDELQNTLAKSEDNLNKYLNSERIVNSQSYQNIMTDKLKNITTALVDAQAKRAEAETQYMQVKEAAKNDQPYDSLQAVLQNPLIQKLTEEQTRLARNVNELSDVYGEKHPKMIAARSDFKEAKEKLKEEIDKVVVGIKNNYKASVENERKLRSINDNIQKELRKDQSKGFKLAKLEREVEINRNLYNVFLTRLKETDVTGGAGVTNVRVIDPAIPPIEPSKPRKKVIILLFLISGLLLSIGMAFLLERLDNTFKTSDDVEEKLSLSMIGITPVIEAENGRLERYAWKENKSLFSESISNIRTGILFSDIDNPPKIVMVTSSIAEEGKTTLSNNLALSFSSLGKTLMLEADLRKPRQLNILNRNIQPGLSELASGNASLDECLIQDEESEDLYYLTSGMIPAKPLELLSSKKVEVILAELRAKFDYIVIDTAPVLPVSDPLVLGQYADAVILAIKSDSTVSNLAEQTLKRLKTAGISPVGVVLTQAHEEKLKQYGGHYQYQYYEKPSEL